MKIKDLIRFVVQHVAQWLPFGLRRPTAPAPRPEQLDLGFDQLTATGLPLRAALPVRSAEYWLQLGQPSLALTELASLPDAVRRHEWPMRVRLAALNAANPLNPP